MFEETRLMARVITIGSQKGGVGKSTTVLNLGYSLSRLGQRVLLVDADPQSGMSIATNLSRRAKAGLVQILLGTVEPLEAVTFTRDRALAGLNTGIVDPADAFYLESASRDGRLAPVFAALDGEFDYVLLDAPAGVGSLVHGLLAASHGTILVVRCQTILVKSLPAFLKAVQYARDTVNPGLRLIGALMTMRDPRDVLDEQLSHELIESFPASVFFKTQIPLDPVYEIASQRAVPVARLSGALQGARTAANAYMDLALEFRERDAVYHTRGAGDEDAEGLF
jgi:chromosome partitioning protein